MSLNSVNTNVGAMLALQSLNAINRELFTVQNRISTGLKVASAKDDPATWAIAQHQRSELSGLDAVTASLQRGQSIVDVAMTAGESIVDILGQMKQKALAAQDTSLDAASRASLLQDYDALRKQIDQVANNSDFNGVSLISAGSAGSVKALANTRATATINVDHVDLSTSGSILSGVIPDAFGNVNMANLEASIKAATAAVAKLGSGAKALDTHLNFIEKLHDTMEASIGRLVDADIAKEAARYQALQVKQQLAIQALSIANRAPQMLLQLFQ
ncbi:MAG: flagellin [Caulobacteraceae bacterium]